jgi:hypothetical protein
MRIIACAIVVAAAAGCSPVTPWPSFHPAEHSAEAIADVPRGKVALTCRSCPEGAPVADVCAALYPLENPTFCDGRTPDGRRGALVPVVLEYENRGGASAIFKIRRAEVRIGDEVVPSNIYYSDFGRDDFIPPGGSRSLTVGFVVAEEAIIAAESLVVAMPCPGSPGDSVAFEYVARDARATR